MDVDTIFSEFAEGRRQVLMNIKTDPWQISTTLARLIPNDYYCEAKMGTNFQTVKTQAMCSSCRKVERFTNLLHDPINKIITIEYGVHEGRHLTLEKLPLPLTEVEIFPGCGEGSPSFVVCAPFIQRMLVTWAAHSIVPQGIENLEYGFMCRDDGYLLRDPDYEFTWDSEKVDVCLRQVTDTLLRLEPYNFVASGASIGFFETGFRLKDLESSSLTYGKSRLVPSSTSLIPYFEPPFAFIGGDGIEYVRFSHDALKWFPLQRRCGEDTYASLLNLYEIFSPLFHSSDFRSVCDPKVLSRWDQLFTRSGNKTDIAIRMDALHFFSQVLK